MALPALLRKVFESDGYGPKLNRSVIPFAASLASDSATDVASTEWVKDLYNTTIYISPNAPQSNDGFSASSPVTFTKALEIAYFSPHTAVWRFEIAGGTYSENIEISNLKVFFNLNGNVIIDGYLSIYNSTVATNDTSYSLKVTKGSAAYALKITNSTCAFSYPVETTLSNANKSSGLCCYLLASVVVFNKTLTINANPCYSGLYVESSYVAIADETNIKGSSISDGFVATLNSAVVFNGDFYIADTDVYHGASVLNSSHVTFNNYNSFYGNYINLFAQDNSQVNFASAPVNFRAKANGYAVWAENSSSLHFYSGNIACDATSCDAVFRLINGSVVSITGNNSVTLGCAGSGTSYAQVGGGSVFTLSSSVSVYNAFSGRKYTVNYGGLIVVNGAGQDRLPGTAGSYSISTGGEYY